MPEIVGITYFYIIMAIATKNKQHNPMGVLVLLVLSSNNKSEGRKYELGSCRNPIIFQDREVDNNHYYDKNNKSKVRMIMILLFMIILMMHYQLWV